MVEMTMWEDARNRLFYFPELFNYPRAQMKTILQLHWQDRADFSRTEFVGQSPEVETFDQAEAWMKDLIERRKDECPDGWGPLICTQDSEMFVKAAAPVGA